LLIVVAIIGILAAILFPVFARARENARKSSCQSNLKQITLGMAQYVQDYDGTYPLCYIGYNGWTQVIHPYVKSLQVYQCPSEPYPQNPYITDDGSQYYDYTDYFYNVNFSVSCEPYGTYCGGTYNNIWKPLQDSQLAGPAVTVLLGDGYNGDQGYAEGQPVCAQSSKYTYDTNGQVLESYDESSTPLPLERHMNGANYAFADGHVKRLKHTSISRGSVGYYPQSFGWSEPYPGDGDQGTVTNAMPPKYLAEPYSATFSPVDYF
jgi:prepilin-type processing-associated H-X9-DG protein